MKLKVGTILAIIIAVGAGVYLAVSYANADFKGVAISIGLYGAALWLHYIAINDGQKV